MLVGWLPSTGLLAVSRGTTDRISNLGFRQMCVGSSRQIKAKVFDPRILLFWKSLESELWTVMTDTSNKPSRKLYPVPLDTAHTTL